MTTYIGLGPIVGVLNPQHADKSGGYASQIALRQDPLKHFHSQYGRLPAMYLED